MGRIHGTARRKGRSLNESSGKDKQRDRVSDTSDGAPAGTKEETSPPVTPEDEVTGPIVLPPPEADLEAATAEPVTEGNDAATDDGEAATSADANALPESTDSPEDVEPEPSPSLKSSVEEEIDEALEDLFVDPGDSDAKPVNMSEDVAAPEPEVVSEDTASPASDAAPSTEDAIEADTVDETGDTLDDPAEEASEVPQNGSEGAQIAELFPEADDSDAEEEPGVRLNSGQVEAISDLEQFEPDPLAILEIQLQESQAAAQEFRDQLYRKAAELENTRRRLTKQLRDAKKYAGDSVLREFLPVLDDLERAIEHAQAAGDEPERSAALSSLLDGIILVKRKFASSLERFGVKGFNSVGQVFSPRLHEAIQQIETTEYASGVIASEFLRGYMMHDRLLRPALVVVAHNPTPAPKEAPVEPEEGEEPAATQEEPPTGDDGAAPPEVEAKTEAEETVEEAETEAGDEAASNDETVAGEADSDAADELSAPANGKDAADSGTEPPDGLAEESMKEDAPEKA